MGMMLIPGSTRKLATDQAHMDCMLECLWFLLYGIDFNLSVYILSDSCVDYIVHIQVPNDTNQGQVACSSRSHDGREELVSCNIATLTIT